MARSVSESCASARDCPDLSSITMGSLPTTLTEATRVLKPLPPKPRHPPPELSEKPKTRNVEEHCRQHDHVAAVVADLRAQEPDLVLVAVAKALLAACKVESENTVPPTNSETPNGALGCEPQCGAETLRVDIERICVQALHSLQDPVRGEVGALLRRVESMLREKNNRADVFHEHEQARLLEQRDMQSRSHMSEKRDTQRTSMTPRLQM